MICQHFSSSFPSSIDCIGRCNLKHVYVSCVLFMPIRFCRFVVSEKLAGVSGLVLVASCVSNTYSDRLLELVDDSN